MPHSLKTQEDIAWLQKNIPAGEWDNAHEANLAETHRRDEEMADKFRRALDLKDLSTDLLDRSVQTEKKLPRYIGQYFVRHDVLGYVCPNAYVHITPSAPSKIDLLKTPTTKPRPLAFRCHIPMAGLKTRIIW